jgi:hypothetical protein
MRQSTIFFIVAVLVLVWFAAEAFPGQQICAMSCESLAGLNLPEQIAAVLILPVLIALGGISMRRSEREKALTARAPASRSAATAASSSNPQGLASSKHEPGQDPPSEKPEG